jgi:hypothetical protein
MMDLQWDLQEAMTQMMVPQVVVMTQVKILNTTPKTILPRQVPCRVLRTWQDNFWKQSKA